MRSKTFTSGLIALGAVGVYYAWRNRFQIQRFLEARGINLPLDLPTDQNLGDTIRSGAAKVAGKADRIFNDNQASRAV